ncbi:unnamed protein product [Larinioides sclopetarius]|uniref:Adenosine deaminase domain-containing protein n=1 Tax=Larinioides sclopetarius TaxID=280406 RepID=A0AAV1Z1G3_9ARAC
MATCDVIEDFYNDGVHYLELRTTPKESDLIATQDMYITTVMKAIEDTCFEKCKGFSVKLLLSIDRKRSPSCAQETLKIAEKYFSGSSSVIGIDLSGNPNSGDISHFLPYLEYAKKIGLKLAIHVSEVPGNFEEVESLLKLEPGRLGHGTYLLPKKGGSTKNFELLKQLKIPIECCLTSNVISKTVSSYEDHHLTLLREMNYPYVLCTDDKGIFNTSLSNEYYLASKYYSLTKHDLFNLSYESIDYIFSPEREKKELKNIWKKYENSC